jgi:hypothetical protein
MNEREAIIPAGMEAVCEKIRYAPAFKVGTTFRCPARLVATWPCSWSNVTKRKRQAFKDLELVLASAGGITG